MKFLAYALFFATFASFVTSACVYNDCHHPEYPLVKLGTCVGTTCQCDVAGFGNPTLGCSEVQATCPTCYHGTCGTDTNCACDSGWEGPLCNLRTCSSCSNGVCQNGTCECYPGFTGANCDGATTTTYMSATFSSDRTTIEVSFNSETNMGVTGGIFPTSPSCSNIVDADTLKKIGTDPKCVWKSPKKLVVQLPFNATITEGDDFGIKDIKDHTNAGIVSPLTRAVGVVSSTITPSIVYTAPMYIGPCDDLVIDATASKNLGGRLGTYTFAVVSGTNITIPANAINGYLRLSGTAITKSVVNPNVMTMIKLSVKVRNFWNQESSVEPITIVRKPANIASVTLNTPMTIDWYNIPGTKLSLRAKVSGCGVDTATTFNYQWSITKGTPAATLPSSSTGALSVPTNVFIPGQQYIISVNAQPVGLGNDKNGTTSVTINAKWAPLSAELYPSKGLAATASGLQLSRSIGEPFSAYSQAANFTSRVITYTCEKSVSGSWTSACYDATKAPNTLYTFPAATANIEDTIIPANVLSPGLYRFKYTFATLGRPDATSPWSVVEVKTGSVPVFASQKPDIAQMMNTLFVLDKNDMQYGLSVVCNGAAASIVWSGATKVQDVSVPSASSTKSTAFFTIPNARKGTHVPIKATCTVGGKVAHVTFDINVGLGPMAGTVDVIPDAMPITPTTPVTLVAKGFYQPMGGRMLAYDYGSAISSNGRVKMTLLPGANNLKVSARSGLGVTTYNIPTITVNDYTNTKDQQMDDIKTKLDNDAADALREKDAEKETSVAGEALTQLKTYKQGDLNSAGQAAMKQALDKSIDLLSSASTNLQADLNLGDTMLKTMADAVSISGVSAQNVKDLVTSVTNVFTTNKDVVSQAQPIPDTTITNFVNVLEGFANTGTKDAANGKNVQGALSALTQSIAKQLIPGGPPVKKLSTTMAFEVANFGSGDMTASRQLPKPTGSSAKTPPSYKFKDASVTGLDTVAMNSLSYNMYGVDLVAGKKGAQFFGMTLYTSAQTKITDTGTNKITFQFDLAAKSGYLIDYALAHFVGTAWTSLGNCVEDPNDKKKFTIDNNKFSDFGVFPVYATQYPTWPLTDAALVAIVVVGVVVILVLGGLGYKFGPKLNLGSKKASQKAAGTARPMLFYDPSAGPGEQWVQIAPEGEEKKKKKAVQDEETLE